LLWERCHPRTMSGGWEYRHGVASHDSGFRRSTGKDGGSYQQLIRGVAWALGRSPGKRYAEVAANGRNRVRHLAVRLDQWCPWVGDRWEQQAFDTPSLQTFRKAGKSVAAGIDASSSKPNSSGLTCKQNGMGTSIPEMFEVLTAGGPSFRPRRVLDIGTQNVNLCTAEEVIGFVNHFNGVWDPDDLAAYAEVVAAGSAYSPDRGGINGAWLGDILTRAGMEYVAYDIFGGHRTTVFDLNTECVPIADRATFDVVINCGTTEHVLNQFNCLKVIHDAVRVGGIIYHAIPMTGYLNHGYFTYSPLLFCNLAKANQYEIIKMNFRGPQGISAVSEKLVEAYGGLVHFDRSDPIEARWCNSPVPDSLITVMLRRTTANPFRAALETNTTAGQVASRIQEVYSSAEAVHKGPANEAAISGKQAAVDRWVRSVTERYVDPDLGFREILHLFDAYADAYPRFPFPPILEKRGLEVALRAHPDRSDLRQRLADVEDLLRLQWLLYQFDYPVDGVDEHLIAEDGIEDALLSLPVGKSQFEHAIVAFRRYMAKGRPERFPLALEFRALCYLTEERAPDDWRMKQYLGLCADKLSHAMVLRRKAPA
jgi:SAM-dependent methyltransferase